MRSRHMEDSRLFSPVEAEDVAPESPHLTVKANLVANHVHALLVSRAEGVVKKEVKSGRKIPMGESWLAAGTVLVFSNVGSSIQHFYRIALLLDNPPGCLTLSPS